MKKAILIPSLVFLISLLLLTYKLGNSTLHPWDEAGYASIARNMARDCQILEMKFNGNNYWDHPPLGFYAIALSFKLFGVSEFTARLPMAVLAAASATVLYLIMLKFFSSKPLALAAPLILISSRWFLIRARSADLESVLLFTQILFFYLSFPAKSVKNIVPAALAFSLSLLAKSAISITLFPLLLAALYNSFKHHPVTLSTLTKLLLALTLPILPWYGYNFFLYGPSFLEQNLFITGLRRGSASGVDWQSTSRTLLYLRSAIHKWFLPLTTSLVCSLPFLNRRHIRWIVAYLLLSAFPYFLSSETQIWHLLTIIPPLSLLIPTVFYELSRALLHSLSRPSLSQPLLRLVPISILTAVLLISLISFSSYWPQIINLPRFVSPAARLGQEAKSRDLPLLLQDNTYAPSVIFYSDKVVSVITRVDDLEKRNRPFQIITRKFLLQNLHDYEVVSTSGDT